MLQEIYNLSPVFLQNVFATAKGHINNRARYGNVYWEHRRWMKEYDSWTLERQYEHQESELRKLLSFAVDHSRFYREHYGNLGSFSVGGVDDLTRLPLVDKELLRSRMEDVYTVGRMRSIEGHTGGTTGKSLTVRFTRDDFMRRMAMLDHFKARIGFENRQMKRASFMGKHIIPPATAQAPFWRYNAAGRQILFSTFHLKEENLRYYVACLNRYKPHTLDGFVSAMHAIAGYIERHDIKLEFQPIALFPTAESVSEETRVLLQRVFGCGVYDQYSSSEGAPFITECSSHTYHVELSTGVFESIEGSNEVAVTSFSTYGTPLIRYRIGDSMIFGEDLTCDCGRTTPTVLRIEGRGTDFLWTAEGNKISAANFSNVLKNMPNSIVRAQAIQTRKDSVTLLLQVDPEFHSASGDRELEEEFRHKFGRATTLEIHHVDEIPNESSGKFRMIKNLV